MKIEIEIPSKEQLLGKACQVGLASKGDRWTEKCLGKAAKLQGIYVIHHNGQIVYVGKTNSPNMSFGRRLRSEFQETASAGKHIYPMLAKLPVPPHIQVSLVPSVDIAKIVRADGLFLNDYEKIEIAETIFIHVFKPEFQLHQMKKLEKALRKIEKRDTVVTTMMNIARSAARSKVEP